MKYFGFIMEHEKDHVSTSIKELIKENAKPHKDKDIVLEYLKNGNQCVPIMGCVEDANDPRNEDDEYIDETFIAHRGVLTDGVWYWPEYVITYIEKYPHFKIDEEFVKQVKKNKGQVPKLSTQRIEELDKYFIREIWGN